MHISAVLSVQFSTNKEGHFPKIIKCLIPSPNNKAHHREHLHQRIALITPLCALTNSSDHCTFIKATSQKTSLEL